MLAVMVICGGAAVVLGTATSGNASTRPVGRRDGHPRHLVGVLVGLAGLGLWVWYLFTVQKVRDVVERAAPRGALQSLRPRRFSCYWGLLP